MPDIVYVDDEPDAFIAHAPEGEKGRIDVIRYGADDPTDDRLERATVWVFDFFLVEPQDEHSSGGKRDENGLSLFQKWRAPVGGARPTTVLISSDLGKAVGEPLGPVERHHVVAQRHGVEWLAAKSDEKSGETWRRVIELADGAAAVAESLKPSRDDGREHGTYDTAHLCLDVLGVPRDAEWANSAQRQVDRARPPREVPVATPAATARTILGWLISHVLPYPSFLLTDAQAALRLQITPETFPALAAAAASAVGADDRRAGLAACRYTGPLANFLGRRWWRAGLDDLAWQLSSSEAGFSAALACLAAGLPVQQLEGIDEPVLLSDADLVETVEVAEARECVRVTEEDFPANVDPAWVRIEAARENRKLAAKVIFEDSELLNVNK